MSLASRVTALATRVGQELATRRTNVASGIVSGYTGEAFAHRTGKFVVIVARLIGPVPSGGADIPLLQLPTGTGWDGTVATGTARIYGSGIDSADRDVFKQSGGMIMLGGRSPGYTTASVQFSLLYMAS